MSATPSPYDAARVSLYKRLSEALRHSDGPWKQMTNKVSSLGTPPGKILDLACGPGEPSATIARAFPNARVIASDIADPMLEKANSVAETIPNLTVQKADMMKLDAAFEENEFDVATCCMGYMFPPDKLVAMEQTLRVLKPGGTLVAVVWKDFRLFTFGADVMEHVLDETPPEPEHDPMALADTNLLVSVMEKAGFEGIETTDCTFPFLLDSDEETAFLASTYFNKAKLDERGPEAWKKAREGFEKHKHKYVCRDEGNGNGGGTGNYLIPNHIFTLFTAKKKSIEI